MMSKRILGATAVALMVLAACSDDKKSDTTTAPTTPVDVTVPVTEPAATTSTVPPAEAADAATLADINAAIDGAPEGCDPLDTRHCFLPYPSNFYTVADASTETGLRVALPADGAPKNADGLAIDLSEWNRNDGFSPSSSITTFIDGLDAEASKLPPWTDLGASLEDASSVVLVDVETGERVALWAEPDSKATDPADRSLLIHPAVSLPEGHTFVVGLRGLVGEGGTPIEPTAAFRVYRDNLTTDIDAIEGRRDSMEANFTALEAAGVDRADLQLAWDFTVASTDNIAGRMLHIRDESLAALGSASPAFTVTAVTPNTDDNIALQVEGTFTVPNYLTGDGGPGNRFHYDVDVATDPDALPTVNPDTPTVQAGFVCNISAATMAGTEPAHIVEYGHGLLGDNHEIDAGNVRAFANEHNVVFCATKWAGMSEDDIGNAAATLASFGNFPTMADRLQQGVLNQIFLGKFMLAADGLASIPEMKRADGTLTIDNSELNYDGNSQGGIMGLMLSAVSPDINRAVLGVAGMNYSLLLPRSVDFATYEAIMIPAYPNELERTLIINVVQMLWDRGEGAGYVQHVTSDPYEGTSAKPVLVDVAYGDHQVSELSALIMARTMGLTIHRPVAADGRWDEVEPGYGLESTTYPSDGSAIIIWDSGMADIPFENLAPSVGEDSHEDPRADADVRTQKASFLFDKTLIDVCDAKACTADHRE